jgi:hypothetical protein
MPYSYIAGLSFLTLGLGLLSAKLLGLLPSFDASPYLFSIFDHTTSLYTLARLTVEPYNPFKPKLQVHRLTYYFRLHSHRLTGKIAADTRSNFEKGLSAILDNKFLGNTQEPLSLSLSGAKNKFQPIIPVALSMQYSFSDGLFHECCTGWELATRWWVAPAATGVMHLSGLLAKLKSAILSQTRLQVNICYPNEPQKYIKLIDLRHSDLNDYKMADLLKILDRNEPQYSPLNHDFAVDVTANEEYELTAARKVSIATNLEAYLRRTTTWDGEQALNLLQELPELLEFLYLGNGNDNSKKFDAAFNDGEISFVASDELGTEFVISRNQSQSLSESL